MVWHGLMLIRSDLRFIQCDLAQSQACLMQPKAHPTWSSMAQGSSHMVQLSPRFIQHGPAWPKDHPTWSSMA